MDILSKIANAQSDRTWMSVLQMLKSALYYIKLYIFIVFCFGFFLSYSKESLLLIKIWKNKNTDWFGTGVLNSVVLFFLPGCAFITAFCFACMSLDFSL